jgi:hypothetical protein
VTSESDPALHWLDLRHPGRLLSTLLSDAPTVQGAGMELDWLTRSEMALNDPSLRSSANARILVQEAYLTDLVDDPPYDEPSMKQLLAAVFESSELNFMHEVVEVIAYSRRPGTARDDPYSFVYDLRLRRRRR